VAKSDGERGKNNQHGKIGNKKKREGRGKKDKEGEGEKKTFEKVKDIKK
jgi:hypothetical protein